MQSGRAKTRKWLVEFEPEEAKWADDLMGWTGSGDMRGQLRIKFDSKEEAVAFAERRGLDYELREPHLLGVRPKNYADNFRHDRMA